VTVSGLPRRGSRASRSSVSHHGSETLSPPDLSAPRSRDHSPSAKATAFFAEPPPYRPVAGKAVNGAEFRLLGGPSLLAVEGADRLDNGLIRPGTGFRRLRQTSEGGFSIGGFAQPPLLKLGATVGVRGGAPLVEGSLEEARIPAAPWGSRYLALALPSDTQREPWANGLRGVCWSATPPGSPEPASRTDA